MNHLVLNKKTDYSEVFVSNALCFILLLLYNFIIAEINTFLINMKHQITAFVLGYCRRKLA